MENQNKLHRDILLQKFGIFQENNFNDAEIILNYFADTFI